MMPLTPEALDTARHLLSEDCTDVGLIEPSHLAELARFALEQTARTRIPPDLAGLLRRHSEATAVWVEDDAGDPLVENEKLRSDLALAAWARANLDDGGVERDG